MSNLALVLQYQGKYDEAERTNQRALKGEEKVLGPDHLDTLTSVGNLASVLQYQGKYDEAEEMTQETGTRETGTRETGTRKTGTRDSSVSGKFSWPLR